MTERLLQFLWQFQYFNKGQLTTQHGENLQIIFPGQYNTNQGPDFLEAKVRIANTTWAGNIELHFRTSDWEKHNHHRDDNYNNVILHVVWENDTASPNSIPILELKERVSKILLQKYDELMKTISFIPCENSIRLATHLIWKSWKERLLAERLIKKSKRVEACLHRSNFHWEEVFWWLLARNFGMKVNADSFEEMARSIPLSILAKHKNQIHQLESLLLGQLNLLNQDFKEDYPKMLKKEYDFYKKKYDLKPCNGAVFFLRMRPGNFPTIRLAQLATLILNSAHLFSKIKEATSVNEIRIWFDVTANDYWHYHYRFDDLSLFRKKKLGTSMTDSVMTNTIVPMVFAYGSHHNDERYKQKALRWLEETSAENNSITKRFQHLGIKNDNAFDSQALIELKNEYCDKKRCLECSIGNSILKL